MDLSELSAAGVYMSLSSSDRTRCAGCPTETSLYNQMKCCAAIFCDACVEKNQLTCGMCKNVFTVQKTAAEPATEGKAPAACAPRVNTSSKTSCTGKYALAAFVAIVAIGAGLTAWRFSVGA